MRGRPERKISLVDQGPSLSLFKFSLQPGELAHDATLLSISFFGKLRLV